MSLRCEPIGRVPEETAWVARGALANGNWYMRLRDELGTIYQDEAFAPLFPTRGRPAEAPGVWQWSRCCSVPKICRTGRLSTE